MHDENPLLIPVAAEGTRRSLAQGTRRRRIDRLSVQSSIILNEIGTQRRLRIVSTMNTRAAARQTATATTDASGPKAPPVSRSGPDERHIEEALAAHAARHGGAEHAAFGEVPAEMQPDR